MRSIDIFLSHVPRIIQLKIRFLGQNVCPVARSQTDGHTDRVTTEDTLSAFQEIFLLPIIKDRSNVKLMPSPATIVSVFSGLRQVLIKGLDQNYRCQSRL